MLALDAHCRARFAQEALDGLAILAEIRHQDLDGDPLLQLNMQRSDDVAHPALTENLLDPIFVGE